jgi:hypothetical protein
MDQVKQLLKERMRANISRSSGDCEAGQGDSGFTLKVESSRQPRLSGNSENIQPLHQSAATCVLSYPEAPIL